MYLTPRIPSRIECRIPDILLLQVLEYGSVSDQLLEASGHSSLSGSGSGRFFREPSPTLTDAGRFMGDVYSFGIIVWEVLSTQVQCVVVDFPKRGSRFVPCFVVLVHLSTPHPLAGTPMSMVTRRRLCITREPPLSPRYHRLFHPPRPHLTGLSGIPPSLRLERDAWAMVK